MEGIICKNAAPNYIGFKVKKDKIGNYDTETIGTWVKSLYNNGNPLKNNGNKAIKQVKLVLMVWHYQIKLTLKLTGILK